MSIATQLKKCPVCGKNLTNEEYDKALGIWDTKHEQIKHLQTEQENLKRQAANLKKKEAETRRSAKAAIATQKREATLRLRQQREIDKETFKHKLESQTAKGVAKGIAKQSRDFKKKELELDRTKTKMDQTEKRLKSALVQKEKGDEEIRRLKEQLEKGITPQIEGLLEEDKLLAKLKELFPNDEFEHTGKGGDIIQTVIEQGNSIGKIVYECKKTKSFSQNYIKQTSDARELRKADFAVLVTNAFPSKQQFYFVSKTVFVISPVSVEAVTYTLRESIVKISMLQLSNAAKEKAVNEVYKYLAGNEYTNKINLMASQLIGLADDLKSEMNSHHLTWRKRYNAYQGLYLDLGAIDTKLKGLLALSSPQDPARLLPDQRKGYPLIEGLEKR